MLTPPTKQAFRNPFVFSCNSEAFAREFRKNLKDLLVALFLFPSPAHADVLSHLPLLEDSQLCKHRKVSIRDQTRGPEDGIDICQNRYIR